MAFPPDPTGALDAFGELLGAGILLLVLGGLFLVLPLTWAFRTQGRATFQATRSGALWGLLVAVGLLDALWIATHLGSAHLAEGHQVQDLAIPFYLLLWTSMAAGVVVAWRRADHAAPPGARSGQARGTAAASVGTYLLLAYLPVEFLSSCLVGRVILLPSGCN